MIDLFSYQPPARYPDAPGSKERGGTSDEAVQAMAGSAGILRGRVLRLLQTGCTMTADEIAAALGESILSTRPRVSELSRLCKIERTGEKRENASGMRANVWRIVSNTKSRA